LKNLKLKKCCGQKFKRTRKLFLINNIEEIEKSFNPRLSVPNFEMYLEKSKKKAALAKKKLFGKINLRYGNSALQTLDVYYNNNFNLPIHIFIHGGYWRALDKSFHTHMALPFVKKKICFFNINYGLCPSVKLSEIKNQIIECIVWIHRNAKRFNANSENIILSGHSAGAHLASLMLSVNWKKYGINKNFLKGVVLISGIYDTEIVVKLNINKEIGLSIKEARNNNPLRKKPKLITPAIISYGGKEPIKWKEQSTNYMNFLNQNGFNCKEISCKKDNHFSLIDTLASNKSKIVKEMIQLSYSS
tara:strand:+ start:2847 stop:3755 length:909 start_codon:yes stop_codon:yes gene_type:complete